MHTEHVHILKLKYNTTTTILYEFEINCHDNHISKPNPQNPERSDPIIKLACKMSQSNKYT